MEFLSWTLAAFVGIVCLIWMKAMRNSSKKYPPGIGGIPVISEILHMATASCTSVLKMTERLGSSSYMVSIFGARFMFVTSLEDYKEAVVAKAPLFSSKGFAKNKIVNDAIQTRFLFSSGSVWKEKRRFAQHYLKTFGKSSSEETIQDELSRIYAILDGQETVAFNKFFFRPIVNVIWGMVAGQKYDYNDQRFCQVSDAILSTFNNLLGAVVANAMPILKRLPGDPFSALMTQTNYKIVNDFIEKHVDEHRATLTDGEPRNYIDAYLIEMQKWNGKQMTEEAACYCKEHLIGGIVDILLAGVETTSTTLEWSLLYIALWPEIQKKVQDEIDAVIGRNRQPTYSDNVALPYVRATIMEIQRYCAVVPLCSPRVTTTTTSLGKYVVPKGTLVFVNLFAIHHDKKFWGDPEVFRPERYLTANGTIEKPDAWLPYSVGPRVCLGESLARMELFLFLTAMLHRYSFECVSGKPLPTTVPVNGGTLRPQPFELVIRKRTP